MYHLVIYICSPTRYTKCFNEWVYSSCMSARHVSDLIGPSSGAFCTSCMYRFGMWYYCAYYSTRPAVSSSRTEVGSGKELPRSLVHSSPLKYPEDRGSTCPPDARSHLPVCTVLHIRAPYLNIYCLENLESHKYALMTKNQAELVFSTFSKWRRE